MLLLLCEYCANAVAVPVRFLQRALARDLELDDLSVQCLGYCVQFILTFESAFVKTFY